MTKRRRRRRSSPAQLPDIDEILTEILLRLPPHPSSLPRAGLVCKRWRRLVTDPHFVRRFRAHHRTPPLLGFFGSTFFRIQEAQNRIPASHCFSLDRWRGNTCSLRWYLLHSCQGLVLYGFDGKSGRIREFVVADPMTGYCSRIPNKSHEVVAATVVPVAGDFIRRSFRLVVLFSPNFESRVCASVYSSDSGTWLHSVATVDLPFTSIIEYHPSILSGTSTMYWLRYDGVIVQFDLERHSLAMVKQPSAATRKLLTRQLATAGDGRFGFAFLSGFKIKLWERKDDLSSAAKWVLRKTIRLDKVLPLGLKEDAKVLGITGFDEESNVIFVCTNDGVFTTHLDSTEVKKVYGKPVFEEILPYSSF